MNSLRFSYIYIVFIILLFSSCGKKGESNAPSPQNGPSITSLSVTQGGYDTEVKIIGTGFSYNLSENRVFFNGKPATITAATSTQLAVTVPLGAGTGNVTVSVKNGALIKGPVFTYQLTAIVSTFAGSGKPGAADGLGIAAEFNQPSCIAIDPSGNFYVGDFDYGSIRKITPNGVVSTIVNTSHNPTPVNPNSIALDAANNIYVVDASNKIYKISQSGNITLIAGNGTFGLVNGSALNAEFAKPVGLALDPSGNIYVADAQNYVIRKISTTGIVSTFAGSGVRTVTNALGTMAAFVEPWSITFNAAANQFCIADTQSGSIRSMDLNGYVGNIVLQNNNKFFYTPNALTTDAAGNIYVVDAGYNAFGYTYIKKITPDGAVSIVAGNGYVGYQNGLGSQASFNSPSGIAVDATGNLYIADENNNVIRKIIFQ